LREVAERLGGAVALVSGRKIETLDELFTPLNACAGLHGVERRKSGGAVQGASFVDAQLDRARASIKALVEVHPGTLFEDKDRTIAVHFAWRAARRNHASRDCRYRQAARTNYHIQSGKMAVRNQAARIQQGTAIKAFMKESPFSGRRPVFAGDDLTDQDGFAIVEAQAAFDRVGDHVRVNFTWRMLRRSATGSRESRLCTIRTAHERLILVRHGKAQAIASVSSRLRRMISR